MHSKYWIAKFPKQLDQCGYIIYARKPLANPLKLYVIDKIKLLGVESSNVGNMLKFATILSIKIKATRPL